MLEGVSLNKRKDNIYDSISRRLLYHTTLLTGGSIISSVPKVIAGSLDRSAKETRGNRGIGQKFLLKIRGEYPI